MAKSFDHRIGRNQRRTRSKSYDSRTETVMSSFFRPLANTPKEGWFPNRPSMTGRDAALRRPRMSTEGRLSIGFRDRPRGRRSAASLPVFERAVQKPPLLGVLCSVDEPRCHVTENKGIII